MKIISAIAKLFFQQPLLKSSVLHDPSEIILICWFGAQETFLTIIYQCWQQLYCLICLWTHPFLQDYLMN